MQGDYGGVEYSTSRKAAAFSMVPAASLVVQYSAQPEATRIYYAAPSAVGIADDSLRTCSQFTTDALFTF